MKPGIVFDLDGTLCTDEKGNYKEAKPYKGRIQKVNSLFDSGVTIIIDTARGSVTGEDWREVTEKQLEDWGVRYTLLKVGEKTYGKIYVDDNAINAETFFKHEG